MYWLENSPKYFVWNSNLWFYNFIALKWDLCEGISANNRKNCVCDQIHINSNHRCINVTHKKRRTVQKRSIYCQGKNAWNGSGWYVQRHSWRGNVQCSLWNTNKNETQTKILHFMGLAVGLRIGPECGNMQKNNFSSGSKVNTRKKHIIFISTKKYPLRIWNIEGRKGARSEL